MAATEEANGNVSEASENAAVTLPLEATPSAPDEPGTGKKDEVDDLMAKYDNEEKHEQYLKSDEYKRQIQAKKDAAIQKEQDQV